MFPYYYAHGIYIGISTGLTYTVEREIPVSAIAELPPCLSLPSSLRALHPPLLPPRRRSPTLHSPPPPHRHARPPSPPPRPSPSGPSRNLRPVRRRPHLVRPGRGLRSDRLRPRLPVVPRLCPGRRIKPLRVWHQLRRRRVLRPRPRPQ